VTHRVFQFDSPGTVDAWRSIDDVVMGGVSASRLRFDSAGHAVFEGCVSLENNGGFASIRSDAMDLGVAGASHYEIELRGDPKRYKFNLRTDDSTDGVLYQVTFMPAPGDWARLRLLVADFRPTFRGRPVSGAPPLDPARVRQMGFLIGDRQSGRFSLSLRSIVAG